MKPLLTFAEVCELANRSVNSIRRDVADGAFPKPIRLGRRSIRWRAEEVEAFLQNKPAVSLANSKGNTNGKVRN